jgi:hypothetical protein
VFFPTADTIAVTTNGTERLRIDSSGNVGIGTTSPSSKLQINGTNTNLTLTGTAGGTENILIGADNGVYRLQLTANDGTGAANIGNPTGYPLYFFTNGITNTAMTILSGGNVGVGTASPSAKLDVNGTAGSIVLNPSATIPTINTTGPSNLTIASSGGDVIIVIG